MDQIGAATRTLLASGPSAGDDRDLARRVCGACVDNLEIDGAAISVLTTSVSRQTLWASDATAELLEDLQFSLNEGACIQAATSGSPVFVSDLVDSPEATRWPIFAAAVMEQSSARALFALPLQWGVTNLGVLDLYRHVPGGLDQPQWRDALSAADLAALLLVGIRTDPGTGVDDYDGGWLDPTLGSRAEVHQATGMVLVQLGVSPTEALARLRAHAFVHQRLLIDVARDVVHRRLVFTVDME